MRVAVRSRYTNISGGYEERGQHQGRPAFRRTSGDAWLFRDDRFNRSGTGGGGPRWHFGPALPSTGSASAAVFFSSLGDAPAPQAAEWPNSCLERVWEPGKATAERPKLFVDKGFPPALRSIGEIPAATKGREPEWVPVRYLRAGTWELFQGGISPNDLLQGAIGNCWLVAAMASLAEFPEAVEAVFGQKELSESGRCGIILYDARCTKLNVTVDEYIPCHPREWWDEEGTPLFARPNGNEAWVLLLEKAFAKMLGSYRELSGGNCCTAFRAFTGERKTFVWARSEGEAARVDGEWKRMQLADGEDHFEWTPGEEQRRNGEGLWREVRNYDRQSFLVACSMRARTGLEHVRIDGLVEAHAYSVLHAVEVEGHRLLFLRNPWGNDKRWNGRWSDGDDAWAANPGVRRRLRPEFRDDGAFWMAWVDFQAIFDFVYVCARTMRSGKAVEEHARWSADGQVPVMPVPRSNPRRRIAEALPELLPRLPVGSQVELMRQVARPDLSGRVMEVIGWDDELGKYELRGTAPLYWTCPNCGEVNKRTREACNVCGGIRDEVAPGAIEAPRYHARPEDVVLPPGTEMEVQGLTDFPELNGQPGTIVAFERRSGRYHVKLPDGVVRAIRPPHVVARRPPPEEAEFGRWTAPAPEPNYVDEPEPPVEAPCDSDEEVRRIFDELDEESCLRKDVEDKQARWRLRRGQQLLREGELRGQSLADMLRAGRLRAPLRLRFTRRSPGALRAGAHWQAVMELDAAIAKLLQAEEFARGRLGPGLFSFLGLARPGWSGVPEQAKGAAAASAAKAAGWGGWICPECGHINKLGTDVCRGCDPDCDDDDDDDDDD